MLGMRRLVVVLLLPYTAIVNISFAGLSRDSIKGIEFSFLYWFSCSLMCIFRVSFSSNNNISKQATTNNHKESVNNQTDFESSVSACARES